MYTNTAYMYLEQLIVNIDTKHAGGGAFGIPLNFFDTIAVKFCDF